MTIFNYTVNYIDVALAAFVIIVAAIGCHRGLLLNVVNFIRWSVGLFLCFFVSSNYSQPIYDNIVRPRALQYITEKITTSNNLDVVLENLSDFEDSLPASVAKMIDFSSVTLSGENIAESVLESVFQPFLLSLTKAAVYVAVFLVFFIITGIIIAAIKHHNRKKDREGDSKLRKADKALGFVLGAVKGVLIVFAFCSILMLAIDVADDAKYASSFLEYAKTSSLLELINEINPFNAVTEGII